MSTQVKKSGSRTAVVIVFVITIILTSIASMMMGSSPVEMRTDIKVNAFVGIPSEKKVGGIDYTALNRWGYDKVLFQVRWLNKGLNLNGVVSRKYCSGGHIEQGLNQWMPGEPGWNTWLERFEEVLAEVTTGEKSNIPNTPGSR